MVQVPTRGVSPSHAARRAAIAASDGDPVTAVIADLWSNLTDALQQ